MKSKIILLSGARPNFMKIFPLWKELIPSDRFEPILIHTGQHYDPIMSDAIFQDLELPDSHYHLGVGSGTHAVQTAQVMMALEPILEQEKPAWLVVVGDVNSTLAGALTASKLGIPIAHVEAGLRSFDRTMPEEINRVLTDSISDALFTSCRDADENLKREGVAENRIHFVGNIMIDSLRHVLPKTQSTETLKPLGLDAGTYLAVTLHRPSNVDHTERLHQILCALRQLATAMPVVFPVHPRTRKQMQALGAEINHPALHFLDPMAYIDFLSLVSNAGAVLTDSGGIQEETSFLGIPCVTLRPNTERPITITEGTNQLFTGSPKDLPQAVQTAWQNRPANPPEIEGWDGDCANRIVQILSALKA